MNYIVKKSILSRLIIIIAGASIISVIITSFGHYLLIRKMTYNSINEQAESTLTAAEYTLREKYQNIIEHDLLLLQQSPLIRENLTNALISQQTTNLLQHFIQQSKSFYEAILVTNQQGHIISQAYSDSSSLAENSDLTKINAGEISNRLKYQAKGTIIFIGPKRYDGKNIFFAGVLSANSSTENIPNIFITAFNLEPFYQSLNGYEISNHSIAWLYTQTGQLLHQPQQTITLDPFEYIFNAKNKNDDIIIKSSKVGQNKQISGLLKIIISLPPEIITTTLLNSFFIAALFIFTISIIVVSIAYYTAKKILLPIQKLTMLSQKVASGDFNVRMPETGNDELGTLGQAFNIMIQELDEQRYELQSLANIDTLTQLPNRRQFEEHLSLLIRNCNRNNQSIAVMYIDLDQFKDTNDTFGHPAGDKLIREVSSRLVKTVRQSDLVARLGGDEFAIIINPHKTKTDTEFVAKKILAELNKPFIIEKQHIFSGGSIGISIYPEHGENATTLVKNADAAMYKAKNTGRNNFQFYSENLTEKANERIVLGSLIRHALAMDQFSIHYQSKVDLETKKLIGAEALLRWQHKGQTILPSKIIGIAESSGFIERIDAWVIYKACEHIKYWESSGAPIVPISVNISGRLLEKNKVVSLLNKALHKFSLDPKWLEIEITENDLISNAEKTQKMLKIIHSLGVKVAIDDFGTGYSSISYLKDLLADTLKIDRKFVVNAMKNYADREIASAIVKLAKALHMQVVVEGIESEDQEQLFRELGAQAGQGFLYSKPMPLEQFSKHLVDSLTHSTIDDKTNHSFYQSNPP